MASAFAWQRRPRGSWCETHCAGTRTSGRHGTGRPFCHFAQASEVPDARDALLLRWMNAYANTSTPAVGLFTTTATTEISPVSLGSFTGDAATNKTAGRSSIFLK